MYILSPRNTFRYMPDRNVYICLTKDMYKIVCSSIIHYSYKVATVVEWINNTKFTIIVEWIYIYCGLFAQ